MRNYDILVTKIYYYALIDSFGGFPGFIDSLTSYATLVKRDIFIPKCTKGEGDPPVWKTFLKKN